MIGSSRIQGERAGEAGESLVQREHPEGEHEQPGDDRGDAGHDVDQETNRGRQHPAGELRDVDRDEQPERDRDEAREQNLLERADDRVVDASAVRKWRDPRHRVREEGQAEQLDALLEHVEGDQAQRQHREREEDERQAGGEPVLGAAAPLNNPAGDADGRHDEDGGDDHEVGGALHRRDRKEQQGEDNGADRCRGRSPPREHADLETRQRSS